MADSSASMRSSSERAPLLSPSQRRHQRGWGRREGSGQGSGTTGIWERLFGKPADDEEEGYAIDDDGLDTPAERRAKAPRNVVRGLSVLLALMFVTLLAAVARQEYIDHSSPRFGSGRNYKPKLAEGTHGAVAAEDIRCSQIGVDALKEGGNAVDAAIASTLCTGVVGMFSSGIGGGGFMIVRDPRACTREEQQRGMKSCSNKVVIDFRETAPAAAFPEMYINDTVGMRWGGLASGVPAELRGLEEAHKRFGKLPWARLFAPAIKLAEGTYVSRELDSRLQRFAMFFANDPDWHPTFINPDTGKLVSKGDQIYRKALARTLRDVANNGTKAFYEGKNAESIVAKIQERGGIMTLQDLAEYRPVVRDAVEGLWQGRHVFTTPTPTSGPVLLTMLQVLSMYKDWIVDGPTDGKNAHRIIEAMKFASAQRTLLGDPAYMNETALDAIAHIPTLDESRRVYSRINDSRTYDIDYYEPFYDVKDSHGTMHLSTLDKEGMAVALTSTVNLPFGSAVLDPNTGVIMNDEMDDTSTPGVPNAFGLYPSPYNYPQPGKRPLSSTSPTIVEEADGSFLVVLGGAGGSRIFGSVAQVLLNLDWGMDVSAAIERPRIHHQLLPTYVSAESTIDGNIVGALEQRGHEVQIIDINLAVAEVQAVVAQGALHSKERRIYAASDSRKGAIAVAY